MRMMAMFLLALALSQACLAGDEAQISEKSRKKWGVELAIDSLEIKNPLITKDLAAFKEKIDSAPGVSLALHNTRGRGTIGGRLADIEAFAALEAQKLALIAYLQSKILAEDWHAVQDAASDIREIEAKLSVLALR